MLSYDGARLARVMDVLRGGGNNVREDREAAARMEERWSDASRMLRWCDRFAVEAATAAVAAGLTGVIFGWPGFPSGAMPPHRAVLARGGARARGRRQAWFGYAGAMPEVAAAWAAVVDGDDLAVALNASITEPAPVMDAVSRAALAEGPVQVQLGLAPAYLEAGKAAALTSEWAPYLPSGSQLAMLVPLGGYLGMPELTGTVPRHGPQDPAAWLEKAGFERLRPDADQHVGPDRPRTAADVRAWDRWGWGEPTIQLDAATKIVAAIGRLP